MHWNEFQKIIINIGDKIWILSVFKISKKVMNIANNGGVYTPISYDIFQKTSFFFSLSNKFYKLQHISNL